MIVLYILIAGFISWIWIEYYRMIDIFEKESYKYILLVFLMGAASPLVTIGFIKFISGNIPLFLNGNLLNDFSYCFFKIGMVEEFSKSIPFVIFFLIARDKLNEPLDYLLFFSMSALGFAATENIMYFSNQGADLINNRAILSTVGHMFDSVIIAYGLIYIRFRNSNHKWATLLFFVFLACLSHAFYDFWLIYEKVNVFGGIITIIYFLMTISLFSTMLNNALNNSSSFSYKRIINSDFIAIRLIIYYGIVFVIQFLLLTITENISFAFNNFRESIFLTGFIIVITSLRLSRFKLIQGRWNKIKFELPFDYGLNPEFASMPFMNSTFKIKIKGDSFNESTINSYYEEFFFLIPLSSRYSYVGDETLAFIEKKIFLKNDSTFYVCNLYEEYSTIKQETILIKAKDFGDTLFRGKYPIVAILLGNETEIMNPDLSIKDLKFQGWYYIKDKQRDDH